MRALFVVLSLLSTPALGETIRVAIARGQSLRVEGKSLWLRSGPDASPVAVASPVQLEMVGPFVSTGDQLAPAMSIEDTGAALTIAGVPLAGRAEIRADSKGLIAVDIVELEQYVAVVVGGEMPTDWPAAALEAQAIATRTYALEHRRPDAPFDVEATVISQVYHGRSCIEPAAVAAARNTAGRVLDFGGALAEAYFFASCGGTTESSANAFGHAQPYLRPVACELPNVPSWSRAVPISSAAALFESAGLTTRPVTGLVVESRNSTGRVAAVRATGGGHARSISGTDLRRALGYQTLPSLDFTVRLTGNALVFEGRGSGHGVGLCQWCAREMAAKGKSSEEILTHFYPGTRIVPASNLLAATP